MEEKISLEHDSNYTDFGLDNMALVEACSKIKKLETEVALSRIRIDQSEKDKHDLIVVIKKQHDKFIYNRLDSLIGQLDANVSFLNELIATMKRTDYKYDFTSLHRDDRDIVDEQNSVMNESKKENDGLTSVTIGRTRRVTEYSRIQKFSEPHISDDDDPITINDSTCDEVLTISDEDDSDRIDFQRVSRPTTPTIVELDDSSTYSTSKDYYFLSDSLNEASPSKNDSQLRRTSFLNAFQEPTLGSHDTSILTKHETLD